MISIYPILSCPHYHHYHHHLTPNHLRQSLSYLIYLLTLPPFPLRYPLFAPRSPLYLLRLLRLLGRLPRWPHAPSIAPDVPPATSNYTMTTTSSEYLPNSPLMTRTRTTRPRSHTFYLPLAPSDAPLSLKAKLSVLPPQAANALLAPRARSSTAPSTPSCNSDSSNLYAHNNPCPVLEAEDECARLERVLGCATRAKDGTSRYRAASPELRNDWSTPSPPRSPSPEKPKEIIHVDMELDPPPILATLPTPPPTPRPLSSTDHYHYQSAETIPEPSEAGNEPEMVFELDNEEVSSLPSSLAASPRSEVTSHRR